MEDTSPGSVLSIITSYDMEDPDHQKKKRMARYLITF
jgi:hypothetical protein